MRQCNHSESAGAGLFVVHLVRRGNPLRALEQFLASYRAHPAGAEHQLVLLCKGFASPSELSPILDRLDGLAATPVDVPDDGFDLTAYRRLADVIDHGIFCYLNSNSRLLADGWLAAMVSGLSDTVGIVGATGSWNSGNSSACYELHLPGPYSAVFPDRAWRREQFSRLNAGEPPARGPGLMSHPPLRYFRTALELGRSLARFRAFPAPHVRTNAILIRRDTMVALRFPRLRTKVRTWQLESGRGSITEQIAAMGLETVVVGRDRRAYRPAEWADSDTLWQGDQENLLVADNQTERYQRGDADLRALLSRLAWGPKARPASPTTD